MTLPPNVPTITHEDDDTPPPEDDNPQDDDMVLESLFNCMKLAKSNKEADNLADALVKQRFGTHDAYAAKDMHYHISAHQKVEISNAEANAQEAEKLASTKRSKFEANYTWIWKKLR